MRLFHTSVLALSLAAASSSSSFAGVLAHWSFDTNTAGPSVDGQPVPHSTPDGIFDGSTPDISGNNNTLSTWMQGGAAGFNYRQNSLTAPQNVPIVPGNLANTTSIKNSGGAPAAMSIDRNGVSGNATPSILNTGNFAAWTVEASWKPETGGFRTVVGRDGRRGTTAGANTDGNLSFLYLQLQPNNRLVISYTDVSGYFHEAATAAGFGDAFDFAYPSDNEGLTGQWMNIAAQSDGTLLTLYVNGLQVAQTNLAASGSPNTALTAGTETNTTDDWYSGGWTVGRGLYNGGHGDRAYGFIDEVRISNSALPYNQLLSVVPEPASLLALAGAAGVSMIRRRRR